MPPSQVAFLLSFVFTFALLFSIKYFVGSYLRSKGFHLSDLILIGLPKDPEHPQMGSHSFKDFSDNFRAAVGNIDVATVATSPTFILTAGVIVATFIWTKVLHTGMPLFIPVLLLTVTRQAAPKVWTPKSGANSRS